MVLSNPKAQKLLSKFSLAASCRYEGTAVLPAAVLGIGYRYHGTAVVLLVRVDGSDNRLGKFLFQIIEATRGGMPARDGNRSPRDDRSWGSRAKDFVICAEAALRGKKGDPYPLNNSSLGRWVG